MTKESLQSLKSLRNLWKSTHLRFTFEVVKDIFSETYRQSLPTGRKYHLKSSADVLLNRSIGQR